MSSTIGLCIMASSEVGLLAVFAIDNMTSTHPTLFFIACICIGAIVSAMADLIYMEVTNDLAH